jgi:hypothetical protein
MSCRPESARAARRALAVLVVIAASSRLAAAQAPTLVRPADGTPPARGVYTISVGVEPAVVLTLGYLHRVGHLPRGSGGGTRVGVRLKLPTTALGNEAWRLDLLGTGTPGGARDWAAPVTGALYAAHNRNRAGTMLGFGTEVRVAPGRYGPRGGLALDLGWQATLRTQVRHSAESRATFDDRYPEGGDRASASTGPVDGWYGRTASRWRLGLAGSRAAGGSVLFQFAVGALVAPQRQGVVLGFDLGQLPFYAEAGAKLGW